MVRYFEGDNPKLVTMGRDGRGHASYGSFRYDGRRYRLTGRFSTDKTEIADSDGNVMWIGQDCPVYREFRRQADEFSSAQARKASAKREATAKEMKELRGAPTMTAFEWRYVLAKEHGLYLNRRQYGCGEFAVYEMKCALPEGCVGERANGKYFKDKEILGFCESSWTCTYNAYQVFNEKTVGEVVAKVRETHEREKAALVKQTERILDVLD